MRRKSLTTPIILIMAAIACGTLLLGYFINLSSLKDALEAREAEKAKNIYFIVDSMIKEDIKRLTGLSRALREHPELIMAAARFQESPHTLPSLHRLLDQWHGQLDVGILDFTDRHGKEIYCCAGCEPGEKKADHLGWGMEEAMEGNEIISAGRTHRGWGIRILAPVWSEKEVLGVLIIGARIDDNFAHKIARATDTSISLGMVTGVPASSLPPERRGLLDLDKLQRSIMEKRAIFHNDYQAQRSFMYSPVQVADETLCLVISSDTADISALLDYKRIHLINSFLMVLGVAILLGTGLTFTIINPLRRLQTRGQEVIKEFSPKDLPLQPQGNEIATLTQAFDLMLEAIKKHIQDLQRAERFQASIFTSIQDSLSIIDQDFTVLAANPASQREVPDRTVIGQKCYAALAGRDEPCPNCPARRTLETGEACREVMEEEGPGGEVIRWADMYTFPLIDSASGEMTGVVKYVRDITELKKAEEAVRKSEENFRLVTETIQDVFWMTDPALNKMNYVSPAYEQIWGRTCQSLYESPRSFGDAIHPEDREQALAIILGAHSQGSPFSLEYRIIRPDGAVRWIYDRGYPIKDKMGHCYLIAGVATDITARKQAEVALHESEKNYRRIVETATEGIWAIDADNKIVFVNHRVSEMLQYSLEEIIGEPIAKFLEGEWLIAAETAIREGLQKGLKQKIDLMMRRKDGVELWGNFSATPIWDEDGRYCGALGMINDITQRKQAEEAVRAGERFLQNIFASIQDAISIIAPDLSIMQVNPTVEKWFAWHPSLVGEKCYRVYRGREEPCDPCPVQRTLQTGQSDYEIMTRADKDGNLNDWVEIYTFPMRDHTSGKLTGVIQYMRDITKRRRTEEILKEKEEQLHQAQKMEAIGRLAGGVAHDFNNILTAVNGYAELLLMQLPPGGPEHQEVHEIRQAVARAASLTRQLLAFSRKQVIQPQALNLNQVVMSLEGMLRRLLGEDIDLALSLGEGLGLVLADPGQMEQVVLNLAVNARDAMPRGGKLHLETADVDLDEVFARPRLEVEPGSYVLLAVSDTGIGMDEAARSRIFEPFYTTKELGKGTGLGLSTVYGIVKQNRGHIWVYSEPGQGTTFKIYLPRMAPLADVAKISVKPAVLPRGWETVLLVEDDEMVRQVTSKMLQRQGYRVLEAAGGLEALKVCDSHREPVHLILTDVVMPGISGPEMAARAIQKHPGIKVLFMSGHTENTIVHHGVLEPGVAFLQKPFKYNDLICRVREVLDRTGECGVSGDYREPQN